MHVIWIGQAGNEQAFGCPMLRFPAWAGFPSPAEDWQESLDLNQLLIKHPAATFLVRAVGDSMIGAGIFSGDILVVDRSLEAADNRIIVAQVAGDLLVKRFRKLRGKTYLMPENQAYPLVEIQADTELLVWGIVTHVIHAL